MSDREETVKEGEGSWGTRRWRALGSDLERDQATVSKRTTQATIACYDVRAANGNAPQERLLGSVLGAASHAQASSFTGKNQGGASSVNVKTDQAQRWRQRRRAPGWFIGRLIRFVHRELVGGMRPDTADGINNNWQRKDQPDDPKGHETHRKHGVEWWGRWDTPTHPSASAISVRNGCNTSMRLGDSSFAPDSPPSLFQNPVPTIKQTLMRRPVFSGLVPNRDNLLAHIDHHNTPQ
jgi:hypothetical protein